MKIPKMNKHEREIQELEHILLTLRKNNEYSKACILIEHYGYKRRKKSKWNL